jgi:hypothetical protein
VDILIESTKVFEQDLAGFSQDEQALAKLQINDCASLFSNQEVEGYRKLRRLRIPENLNGYESSLYTLQVSENLRIILAIDEDPIFEQMIFTLFRAVRPADLDNAYQSIAESLYQDLRHCPEIAQIS